MLGFQKNLECNSFCACIRVDLPPSLKHMSSKAPRNLPGLFLRKRHTWILQLRNMSAFSSIKPAERQHFAYLEDPGITDQSINRSLLRSRHAFGGIRKRPPKWTSSTELLQFPIQMTTFSAFNTICQEPPFSQADEDGLLTHFGNNINLPLGEKGQLHGRW